MSLFRCLLLLALIVAASGTFGRRLKWLKRGRCGRLCGLTKRSYVRPSRRSGRCLQVLDFLRVGVNSKLSVAKELLSISTNVEATTSISTAAVTCSYLSRSACLIIDKWIGGLGSILERLIIGITRVIFCVLGNPWENGNYIDRWITKKRITPPAVCDKEFGVKWGFKKFGLSYKWETVVDYYGFNGIRAEIDLLIKGKSLDATQKLIIDTLYQLTSICQRDFASWKRSYYGEVLVLMTKIYATLGSGYKVGTGVAVVDECSEYFAPACKKEISYSFEEKVVVVKEEIQVCNTQSFNGALVADVDINVDVEEETKTEIVSGGDGDD